MTLAEYVKTFPRLQRMAIRKCIANQLGVSEINVRSMCNGNKSIPAKYALLIEKITDGVVPKHVTAPAFYPLEIQRKTQ